MGKGFNSTELIINWYVISSEDGQLTKLSESACEWKWVISNISWEGWFEQKGFCQHHHNSIVFSRNTPRHRIIDWIEVFLIFVTFMPAMATNIFDEAENSILALYIVHLLFAGHCILWYIATNKKIGSDEAGLLETEISQLGRCTCHLWIPQ